jgi:O-antigen/teichoic acid export membrane protein
MLVALPVILVSHNLWILVLPWGVGALAGGALGLAQTRLTPAELRASVRWWTRRAWPLARWLAIESVLLIIQLQFAISGLTAILGAADVGGLRSVNAVFAPMTLLTQAIALPALPMLTKMVERSRRLALRWALRLSALAVGLVLGYLLLVALLPGHLVGLVFGRDFDRYSSLIPPVAVLQLLAAGSLGLFILVKAEGRGRALVLSRAIATASTGVLTITLAITSGLTAAVWGVTLGWATGAVTITSRALRPRLPDEPESQPATYTATMLSGPTAD